MLTIDAVSKRFAVVMLAYLAAGGLLLAVGEVAHLVQRRRDR